jgi:hypothetical protein
MRSELVGSQELSPMLLGRMRSCLSGFDVHCIHAERLEQVVDSLARHGPVTTSLVLHSYPPKSLPTAPSVTS